MSNPADQFMPPKLMLSVRLQLFKFEGGSCPIDFHELDGRNAWFNESSAAWFSFRISRLCEFRIVMGIMTGYLGVACEAPLDSGRMITSNPEQSNGFDCIILPELAGATPTTPAKHRWLSSKYVIYAFCLIVKGYFVLIWTIQTSTFPLTFALPTPYIS